MEDGSAQPEADMISASVGREKVDGGLWVYFPAFGHMYDQALWNKSSH
jgi:hypothetical protein